MEEAPGVVFVVMRDAKSGGEYRGAGGGNYVVARLGAGEAGNG
jgi:hypothetical protein